MGVATRLREAFPCACNRRKCKERNCVVVFRETEFDRVGSVLVDVNRIVPEHKGERCDFMYVGSELPTSDVWVFLVEFKDKRLDGRKEVAQLAETARIAQGLIGHDEFQHFVPLVVYGDGSHRDVSTYYQNNPVRFHSECQIVTHKKQRFEISPRELDLLRN